jgi:hypothetical protein
MRYRTDLKPYEPYDRWLRGNNIRDVRIVNRSWQCPDPNCKGELDVVNVTFDYDVLECDRCHKEYHKYFNRTDWWLKNVQKTD